MLVSLLQNLAEIKGLSDAKIDKMVEAAKKCDTKSGWQTAATVEKQVAEGDMASEDHTVVC